MAEIAGRFKGVGDDAAGSVVFLPHQHTHTCADGLYRGWRRIAVQEWLEKYIFREAKTVSREMVRVVAPPRGARDDPVGTTAYADCILQDEIARVTKAAGLRGVLGHTIIQFPVPTRRRRSKR